jgi:hypothetical protein
LKSVIELIVGTRGVRAERLVLYAYFKSTQNNNAQLMIRSQGREQRNSNDASAALICGSKQGI